MAKLERVRVGIGGWTYAPWRGTFFPEGLPQKDELHWASRQLDSIEINGTFYRAQTASTFSKWHDAVPDDFVFAVKGPRYATHRTVLQEAEPSIEKFFASGVTALGKKLGPINWQFAPTKTFDAPDFEAFLKLLPARHDGQQLRHAVEVRHASFDTPDFLDLASKYDVAVVLSDKPDAPQFHTHTAAAFTYVRLQDARERYKAGYAPAAIKRWADQIEGWASKREVFVYMINGFKLLAPAAARQLRQRL